jgi:hypothetical protein
MKKRHLFLSVLFLVTISFQGLFSQRDFRPGYIIRNSGDTIHGQILYKAINTSAICTFRATETEKPVEFSPFELIAYRFGDGRYFISRTVELENGSRKVFLEFLLKGKANIYYMRDGSDHYFIEKEKGKMIELTEPEKVLTDANGQDFIKPEQYPGKLRSVMSDCPDIFPSIDRTSLNHGSLIFLGKKYHEKVCTDEPCIVFERQRKPLHVRFGLYGGVSMNKFKFGSQKTYEQNGQKVADYGDQLISDFSAGGFGGIRIEFENILSTFEHASLITDITFQYYNRYLLTETGAYDLINYNGENYRMSSVSGLFYFQNLEVNIKTLMLKVPLLVNYTFLKGKLRPYLNGGVLNVFTLSQNNAFKLERFTMEYGKSIPAYHVGFTLSAGTRFFITPDSFLMFEAGYEYTQSLNVWPLYRITNNLFNLKIGYCF